MKLSEQNRIILNIVVTYSRSIFVLACGIFTGRWLLMALGESDFGLFGVIGGLTLFIRFANDLMAGAVSRFYGISIGKTRLDPESGLDECQKWFNTALFVHTVLPLICTIIGYPCGIYAINHWLQIPNDRLYSCILVYRFTCVTCLLSMIMVPYRAMYVAKQLIAELTIYSFFSTFLHVSILYYMVTHPGFWLTKYSLCNCIYSIAPILIIWIRAMVCFPECTIKIKNLFDKERIIKLMSFAGWHFLGGAGALLRSQGLAIIVNRNFGPTVNAAYSVANNLASQTLTLSSSLSVSFTPAITNACGEQDYEKMRRMAFFTCKIGTLLIMIFALPLTLEIKKILTLWLKTPPEYSMGLCICVMSMMILDRISYGHMIAVDAMGKIAAYQAVLGSTLILTIPIALLMIYSGLGVYSVGYAMIGTMIICSIGRAWFAQKLAGMSFKFWLFKIVFPLFGGAVISLLIGIIPILILKASFLRIIITTCCINFVLLFISWFWILDKSEKQILTNKINYIFRKYAMYKSC